MGIIFGFLSMLGWGISDFLAAKSSRKIGSVLTFFWSQIFSFLIGLIYFFLKFQIFYKKDIFNFFPPLLLIGFLYTIATLFFYEGLIKGKVSLVSPIGASYSWIIVLLSAIFFKEILKTNQIIGIISIIFGVPLLSINLRELSEIKKLNTFNGAKEGLIAMLGWGFALFLITPASRALGWFLPIFALRLFTLLFVAGYIIFSNQSFKINFQPPLFVLLSLIGLLDMGASFTYCFGVSKEYASIVAPIAASFPLVTILLAKIFLKEKLLPNQILGIISVIAGLILISI